MFFLSYKLTEDGVFDDVPKISDHFPKISEDFPKSSEGQGNVPEHFPRISEDFPRCPKISEDSRKLSRKARRCFDDTPTNLSTIKETNLISPKLSISSTQTQKETHKIHKQTKVPLPSQSLHTFTKISTFLLCLPHPSWLQMVVAFGFINYAAHH